LEQASAYDRNCAFVYQDREGNEVEQEEAWVSGKGLQIGYTSGYVEHADKKYKFTHIPLTDYVKQKEVKIIYANEIAPAERKGELKREGYVWEGDE
jgi:hypothetical protein